MGPEQYPARNGEGELEEQAFQRANEGILVQWRDAAVTLFQEAISFPTSSMDEKRELLNKAARNAKSIVERGKHFSIKDVITGAIENVRSSNEATKSDDAADIDYETVVKWMPEDVLSDDDKEVILEALRDERSEQDD